MSELPPSDIPANEAPSVETAEVADAPYAENTTPQLTEENALVTAGETFTRDTTESSGIKQEGAYMPSSPEGPVLPARVSVGEKSEKIDNEESLTRVRAGIAAVLAATSVNMASLPESETTQPPETAQFSEVFPSPEVLNEGSVAQEAGVMSWVYNAKENILRTFRSPEKKVEPDKMLEKVKQLEQLLQWQNAHDVKKYRQLFASYAYPTKPGDANAPGANAAVKELTESIWEYAAKFPENVRAQHDYWLTDALNSLTLLGTSNENDGTTSEEEMLDRLDTITTARVSSYMSLGRFKHQLTEGAKQDLKDGGFSSRTHILERMATVSRKMADRGNDARYLKDIIEVSDELSPVVLDRIKKTGGDRSLDEALFFLAHAGNPEAHRLIAERFLAEKETSGRSQSMFATKLFRDDIPREHWRNTTPLHRESPREDLVGHGGEAIAKNVLETLGVRPDEFIPYWQKAGVGEDDHGKYTQNMQIRRNMYTIRSIEQHESGSTRKLLEEYGVRNPGRYPVQLLNEQIDHQKDKHTPFGATVTAWHDYNAAFVNNNRDILDLYRDAKANGVLLRVVEAGSSADARGRLLQLVDRFGQPLQYLGIRGHGAPERVQMGEAEDEEIDEAHSSPYIGEYFLGIGHDRSSLVLARDAPIFFTACSTGKEEGVAQRTSRVLGRKVTAPESDTQIPQISLTRGKSGKLEFDASYRLGAKRVATKQYASGEMKK